MEDLKNVIEIKNVVNVQPGTFGVEVLVNDRKAAAKLYPRMVIEPAALEDIMIFYANKSKAESPGKVHNDIRHVCHCFLHSAGIWERTICDHSFCGDHCRRGTGMQFLSLFP